MMVQLKEVFHFDKKGKKTLLIFIMFFIGLMVFTLTKVGGISEQLLIGAKRIVATPMTNGVIYRQTIKGMDVNEKLRELQIQFGVYGQIGDGDITVTLWEEDSFVEEWTFDVSEIRDEHLSFKLKRPLEIKEGKNYSFSVEQSIEEGNAAIWLSSDTGSLYMNNQEVIGKSICYQLVQTNQTVSTYLYIWFTLLGIGIFVFLLFNIDFAQLKINKIIIGAIVVFFSVEAVSFGVLEQVKTNIETQNYSYATESVSIEPNEKRCYEFSEANHELNYIEFFVKNGDNTDVYVTIKNKTTGQIYFDRKMAKDEIFYDEAQLKHALRILPSMTNVNAERFPTGDYEIIIANAGNSEFFVDVMRENNDLLDVCVSVYSPVGIAIGIIVVSILGVYISIVLVWIKSKNFDLPKFFLVSAIPLTTIYMILVVPWSIPDARAHFLATYRLSNIVLGYGEDQEWCGRKADVQLQTELWGGIQNPDMMDYLTIADNFKVREDETQMMDFPFREERMEYYSIINYLPAVLGISVGRILGLGTILSVYLARISILTVYIAACHRAIKVTPIGKSIFALVPLLPTSLMISSSISYDPMVLLATLNFTACIFAAYKDPSKKCWFIESMVWAFILGSVKGGGYLILLPLVFILWNSTRRNESVKKIAAILLSGLGSALIFDKILTIGMELFQFGSEDNAYMSASFAYTRPFEFIRMCISTYLKEYDLAEEMIGTALAWLEPTLPILLLVGIVFVMTVFALYERDEVILQKRDKIIFAIIILMTLIFTPMMLLSWTEKGESAVVGLQGRYYLPIMPFGMLLLTKFSLYHPIEDQEGCKLKLVKEKCLTWCMLLLSATVYFVGKLYLTR